MNKRMKESLTYFYTIVRIIALITLTVLFFLWSILKLFIPNFFLILILLMATLFIPFSPKPIQSGHEATRFLHILDLINGIATFILIIVGIIGLIFTLVNKYG